MFVKTLTIKMVFPLGHDCPYSRSNVPRSMHNTCFANDHLLLRKTMFVIKNFDFKNAKISCGRPLRPYIGCMFPSHLAQPILKVKRSFKHAYNCFADDRVNYSHQLFW